MKNSKTVLLIDNEEKDSRTQSNRHYQTMINKDELVGGCCVCSDDQGFSNNALVYCDGKGCTVACHTACYGIVSIPDDDWYCRRCEAGKIRAPCRLCPMIEGAMKRTSDGDWAHVICALYIPEVSFGNDSTMEPIILSKIPSTRFGQRCSLCKKKGRANTDALKGACCECTARNCSQVFHVTCAQQAGFLYEDVRKNNCQYPIYCEDHQPKFSKFIRKIPAFHYKSLEQKSNYKAKVNAVELADSVHSTDRSLSVHKRHKLNDEPSQNSSSLTNLSQFVELNREEEEAGSSLSSSNPNQSIINHGRRSTDSSKALNANIEQSSLTSIYTNISSNDPNSLPVKKTLPSKIKTEENDIADQIIEKSKLNKDEPYRKKRQHSNDGIRRPVGRPPLKKTLLLQQKPNNTSIPLKTEESHSTNERLHIDFYPRRPLTNSSTSQSQPQQERLFPPQTLEEFLEQEWESTSDFLLQQTMPHDVSSLLSCLYQFKSENASLQKKFDELKHRRNSLRVTNANLRRKLSEILPTNETITDSQRLPIPNSHIFKTSKSPSLDNQRKLPRITSTAEMEFFSTNSTSSSLPLPYESINPYPMIKNERIPPTNGLSLELLSQILATSGPQLFAPTWNISNFGYANFPGPNVISLSDESIIRLYPSFEQ